MTESAKKKEEKLKTCGLVMPISSIEGCSEQHWIEVREILEDAIRQAGLVPNLVSNADDVGIIQKRIIQNLYNNHLVVCDVSGKNPNVMFELGLRLAFDKPTIIVKDDKTSYSFDTAPIEHIEYPRDLRFTKIVDFKCLLKEKLEGTLRQSEKDPSYTTFLKHFGNFTVAKLETTEVSKDDFIMEELSELRRLMQKMFMRPPVPKAAALWSKDLVRDLSEHPYTHGECRSMINNMIEVVCNNLPVSLVNAGLCDDPQLIIDRAKKLNILPSCFQNKNETCVSVVRDVLMEKQSLKNNSLD